MLIVISNPNAFEKEAELINQLLDEGLQLFHIRKPEYSEDELKNLLLKINPRYYSKLVFHQYHHLAKAVNCKRLHFTELNRMNLNDGDLEELKKHSIHLSTSIHSLNDYKTLSRHFDYAFLGPVFNSISKKGYKAINTGIENLNDERRVTKLIALGGITYSNLNKPLTNGFDGVAVLGSIWESKDPVKEFIQINKACKHCETTF